jgi:hypothetical protein
VPWVSADSRFEVRTTAERENRSETTPPTSRKSTIGRVRAASTRPRPLAEPVRSSTANASAIGAMVEPAVDVTRAA